MVDFSKKRKAIGLEILSIFFQNNFYLEDNCFGPISSKSTIIELSFEIEVFFRRNKHICWGRFFIKRKAIGLEK